MPAQYCDLYAPWFSLSVTYSGISTVGCCGFSGKPEPFNPQERLALEALWNSGMMQKLRTAFSKNEAHEAGCSGCPNFVEAEAAPPPPKTLLDDRHQDQQRHVVIQKLLQAARRREAFLDSPPAKLALCFSPVCNLRCVMCSQEYYHLNADFQELQAAEVLRNRKWLAGIDEIELCGGEVFASPQARLFIKELALDERLSGVKLRVVSNGLLLDNVIDDLLKFKRLSIHVSLDGVGETYEAIRVGGSWKAVEKNIRLLQRLSKERPAWTFGTSCVLIKESVADLPSLVRYCLHNGIPLTLQPLLPTRNSFPHDLRRNPAARDEICWRERLAEAAELFNQASLPDKAETLISLSKNIEAEIRSGNDGAKHNNFDDVMSGKAIRGKRVMIWGTGSNYRLFFSDWLRSNAEIMNFVGFIDNDREKWGHMMDSHPIFSPKEAVRKAPEVVILAVTLIWREPIAAQIKKLGIDCMIV